VIASRDSYEAHRGAQASRLKSEISFADQVKRLGDL
jgi:hypothetical protein